MVAFVLYLLHDQMLPEKRLAALMADLFGVRLVTATIAGMNRNCAERFQDFAVAGRGCVAAAEVQCASDANELIATIDAIPEAIGKPSTVLADTGYANGCAIAEIEQRGIEA